MADAVMGFNIPATTKTNSSAPQHMNAPSPPLISIFPLRTTPIFIVIGFSQT